MGRTGPCHLLLDRRQCRLSRGNLASEIAGRLITGDQRFRLGQILRRVADSGRDARGGALKVGAESVDRIEELARLGRRLLAREQGHGCARGVADGEILAGILERFSGEL